MTIYSFEDKVFRSEEVRIVLREKRELDIPELDYNYERKLGDSKTVRDLKERINSSLTSALISNKIEFEIVDGNGNSLIHPNILLGKIRNSYIKK